jgi:hypothetical protein
MTGITLEVEGTKKESLSYAYRCRSLEEKAGCAGIVPQIKTVVELTGEGAAPQSRRGHCLQSDVPLKRCQRSLKGGLTSCLSLKKEN